MRLFQTQLTRSLLFCLAFFSIVAIADIQLTARKQVQQICEQTKEQAVQIALKPLEGGTIGNAVYAYDFSTGSAIYDKNGETALPLASLTKLMTVRVALKNAQSPDDLHTITDADLAPEGSIGIRKDQVFSLRSLAYAALIPSSNDAAEALMHSTHFSDQLFFQAMNQEARTLGLTSLEYHSATGLDNADGSASSYGSARDIAALLHKDTTDFPELFAVTGTQQSSITSAGGTTIPLTSTNTALDRLPLLVAGKTGYTLTAGGNLAIVWNATNAAHDSIGAVVLGSTENGRFTDMVQLYNAANAVVAAQNRQIAGCHS